MRQDISPDMVVQALLRDGVLGFRDKGAFLREGVCPNCQKEKPVRPEGGTVAGHVQPGSELWLHGKHEEPLAGSLFRVRQEVSPDRGKPAGDGGRLPRA